MSRLLVCGSRSWADRAAIRNYLKEKRPALVIHGGALGADRIAGQEAAALGIPEAIFPAQWNFYGRAAGFRRNTWMLEFGEPTSVVAFWDGKSPGTRGMINLAQKANIPVEVIE